MFAWFGWVDEKGDGVSPSPMDVHVHRHVFLSNFHTYYGNANKNCAERLSYLDPDPPPTFRACDLRVCLWSGGYRESYRK